MPRPPISWRRIAIAVAVVLASFFAGVFILAKGPLVLRVPPAPAPRPVSSERLRADVERLCGDLAPRLYQPPEHLDRVAAWIAGQFRDAGLAVEEQTYRLHEGEYRNILAARPGADPSLGAVIVGAHYDSYMGMPGADDNASGVAVLLELARTLPPEPAARTVIFAAFTNEEPPFFGSDEMGSAHYARRLVDAKTPVDLMIALDLVGTFDDTPGSQVYPLSWMGLFYPSRGNFIAIVGDTGAGGAIKKVKRGMLSARSIPVESFRSPGAIGGVDWSDHIWFRRLGMPAVMVTDTAFLRMPHYHRTTDTPEKLDYRRMAGVTQALHGVLALEAGGPVR